MIGFIKKLFSGIIAFFSGLLSGKKTEQVKQEATASAEKLAASAEKLVSSATVKTRKARGYFMELVEGEETKQPEVKKSATSNGATRAPAKVDVKPSKADASAKADLAAKADANGQTGKKVDVDLVQTAEGVKAVPAKANAKKVEQMHTETTFAPKYLIPTATNGRRRPGANMSSFLDMARQVKTQG
jgi:hypothetical protein